MLKEQFWVMAGVQVHESNGKNNVKITEYDMLNALIIESYFK